MGRKIEILVGQTLGLIPAGQRARVVRYIGSRGLASRLADLGISPGTEVRMVTNLKKGPVLVEVRGSRYTLGRGLAEKVRVEAL